jgi:hypothetical protein
LTDALRLALSRLAGAKEIAKISIGFLKRRIRTIFLTLRAMTDVKGSAHVTTPNGFETPLTNSLPRDRSWFIA